MTSDDPSQQGNFMEERLSKADRQIRREQLLNKIRELGGMVGGADGEEVSEVELGFLEHVLSWEAGPRSTHRTWLARQGETFMPPAELDEKRMKIELWRLLHALAEARVFFYHTNHLSDVKLYGRLWAEVLPAECPDHVRDRDSACHWDFASGGTDGEEDWLCYYATPVERKECRDMRPELVLPPRRRAPIRRDHRLPVRDQTKEAQADGMAHR